jgi:hypothetical protein
LGRLIIYEYYNVNIGPERADVRVLASLNNGTNQYFPAVIEKSFGKGKVILITTSADTEWNLMPGRPSYLVLLDQIALYLSSTAQLMRNVNVNEPLELLLKPEDYSPSFTLTTPKQGITSLSPLRTGEQDFTLIYKNTENNGLYTLTQTEEDSSPRIISYFSVNVNPEEGDLRRITGQEIRTLYPNFKFEIAGEQNTNKTEPANVRPPSSNIWKYLIYSVLILLVSETILAQIFGNYRK